MREIDYDHASLEKYLINFLILYFRDVAKQVLAPEEQDATLTNIVADLAKRAKSKEWLSFFDLLLGSLISLLRRIHSIHNVIMEAIETANEASNTTTDPIIIPEQQLAAIKVRSILVDI